MKDQDTIIALATPPGEGAIAVIRLSGPRAIDIADISFRGKNLSRVPGHTVHYGKIIREDGTVLDEGLATVFRAPRSYTREDVIELSVHGSRYIIQEVLQLMIRSGARPAQPGEFTQRAFLNGQLDLSQAEAVADLIASENASSHRSAMQQMRGGYSDDIERLRQELIDFASLIELELDFSEEDVEFADRDKLRKLLDEIRATVLGLIQSFRVGNAMKTGIPTAIIGRPNAGKSTLLNALIKEDRAIVSEIPGTTRDTIEESLILDGITYRLIDTAGIRDTDDRLEQIGVSRSLDTLSKSQVMIYVADAESMRPEALWKSLGDILARRTESPELLLVVLNKIDLAPSIHIEDYVQHGLIDIDHISLLSARQGTGIEAMKQRLAEQANKIYALADQSVVSSTRHYEALGRADAALKKVIQGLEQHQPAELVSLDIRDALQALGEITGAIHTDELLESIFSRFCIGK